MAPVGAVPSVSDKPRAAPDRARPGRRRDPSAPVSAIPSVSDKPPAAAGEAAADPQGPAGAKPHAARAPKDRYPFTISNACTRTSSTRLVQPLPNFAKSSRPR